MPVPPDQGREAHMIALLRAHFASLASIAIRGLSVLAGFWITFYIGHHLGPLANGQYALVTQTGIFLSVVAVGGLDLAIVRFFSATVAHGVSLHLHALWRVLVVNGFTASLIIAILWIGGTPLVRTLFGDELPGHAVLFICLILVARMLTRVTSAVLRSQQSYLFGQTIEVLMIPTAVGILLATGLISTLESILTWTALFGLAAALMGVIWCHRWTTRDDTALTVSTRQMMRTALPLWGTVISLNIADWYSLATAATALSLYEAGLYRVAFQIGGALSFVAMGLYSVFTARISSTIATGDMAQVARLTRSATRLATVMVLPPMILIFLFAEQVLGLIAPQFTQAAGALRIITACQGLYVITGPAGLTLAMTGHERINLLISLGGTGLLLLLAPLAAYTWGLEGLATAVGLTLVANNLVSLAALHMLEGINIMRGTLSPVTRRPA